ncbi:hypothetical protein SAMN02910275_00302 [Butyrivibrio sp. INlla18]|uniref:hypothetical protein n=1 Tax=Butyrivibrio sp. INlla18 TaxID=1520806 RepID=UPI00087E0143|nr:hypothetical protein [Butyrivibrio sp. INlla18]SDA41864.1 hypothetical protein SAMN02910275_00302 [Butyrivibrio sp. INlla18]
MKIYIVSSKNRISGGPELAHQLCNAICRLTDIEASMCYVSLDYPYDIAVPAETPKPYKVYKTNVCMDLNAIDQSENVIVFPEGLTYSMQHIRNAKIVMWWMSVDNYIESTHEENLEFIKKNVFLHLFQSYYSMDYVYKTIPNAKGLFLSDYINQEHGKFIYPAEFRENIALYNPAKGYDAIKPLIDKADWLKWIPLVNLDLPHMVLMMEASKIYVDFGKHPGKDRIPREAAADGCCVITNKKGSAAYSKDVPIPEKYKFENPAQQLNEIETLLHDICDNFAMHQKAFAPYREFIAGEKERFDRDTLAFIEMLKF